MGAKIGIEPSSMSLLAGSHANVQVHNHGDAELHVTSTSINGHVHAAPTSFQVAPHAFENVTITSESSFHGDVTAEVTFESNAGAVHLQIHAKHVPHHPTHHGVGFGDGDPGKGDGSPSGDGWGAPGGGGEGEGEGGGGCFTAGTLVLGPDGPRPIETLAIGDEILTIDEGAHRSGDGQAVRARILALHRHDGPHALLDIGGVRAPAVHRWAVVRDGRASFVDADGLRAGDLEVRTCTGDGSALRAAPDVIEATSADVVFNLTTSARTYAVAATADGPFYLVHNAKKREIDPDPGHTGSDDPE